MKCSLYGTLGWGRERRRGGFFSGRAALAADMAQATSLPSCLPFRQRLQGVLLDHGRIDLQICDTTGHSEVRRSGVGSAMRQVWGNACMRTWASAHGAQARTGQRATCQAPLENSRAALQNR